MNRLKVVEAHEINAVDILNIYKNINEEIKNIVDNIPIEEIEERIKQDENEEYKYKIIMKGE